MTEEITNPVKTEILDAVHKLKKKGIIKFDSDIAKELDYSRGAVSEILSLKSGKPVTFSFLHKFKQHYGPYLEEDGKGGEEDKLRDLIAEVEVLKQTIVSMKAQITGKEPALILAELEEAKRRVRLNHSTLP